MAKFYQLKEIIDFEIRNSNSQSVEILARSWGPARSCKPSSVRQFLDESLVWKDALQMKPLPVMQIESEIKP